MKSYVKLMKDHTNPQAIEPRILVTMPAVCRQLRDEIRSEITGSFGESMEEIRNATQHAHKGICGYEPQYGGQDDQTDCDEQNKNNEGGQSGDGEKFEELSFKEKIEKARAALKGPLKNIIGNCTASFDDECALCLFVETHEQILPYIRVWRVYCLEDRGTRRYGTKNSKQKERITNLHRGELMKLFENMFSCHCEIASMAQIWGSSELLFDFTGITTALTHDKDGVVFADDLTELYLVVEKSDDMVGFIVD